MVAEILNCEGLMGGLKVPGRIQKLAAGKWQVLASKKGERESWDEVEGEYLKGLLGRRLWLTFIRHHLPLHFSPVPNDHKTFLNFTRLYFIMEVTLLSPLLPTKVSFLPGISPGLETVLELSWGSSDGGMISRMGQKTFAPHMTSVFGMGTVVL